MVCCSRGKVHEKYWPKVTRKLLRMHPDKHIVYNDL